MVSGGAVVIRVLRGKRWRSPRAIGGALLALGIAVGTLADRVPTRTPWRVGDYFVLVGDFHVHAFPGDGSLAPWMLRREASRAGLDVFAVTNHNMVFTARFAEWWASLSGGPIVIAGQEITHPEYHLIAVGVERTVNADQPAIAAIRDVHAQGGVAIAAHPTPRFHGYDEDQTVAFLDGTEAAHPVDRVNGQEEFTAFFERARQLKPSIAPIGSSDFHVSPALAACRTFVFAREATAAGVIEAIRNGRTVAVDQFGHRYGDAALVQSLDAIPVDDPPVDTLLWRRASLVLAWVGLLVLLVL
jgi:predicted metal-dependent phosphoesterase TrpH